MTAPVDSDPVRLLHVLGYLYGQHGETKRGIVMLLIAVRLAPGNVGGWKGGRGTGCSSRIQGDSPEQPQYWAVTSPDVRTVFPHFAQRQILRTSKSIRRPGPFT